MHNTREDSQENHRSWQQRAFPSERAGTARRADVPKSSSFAGATPASPVPGDGCELRAAVDLPPSGFKEHEAGLVPQSRYVPASEHPWELLSV